MTFESYSYLEADNPQAYEKTIRRSRWLLDKLFGFDTEGQKNIPEEGPGTLAFVHRSNIDPWVLGTNLPRALRGMGKDKLWNWYWFGAGNYLERRGVFPVDRDHPSKESYEMSIDIARQGQLQALAPEGTHHNKGPILGPTRFGLGRILAMATYEGIDCPVVPVGMYTERLRLGHRIPVVFGEQLHFTGTVETIKQRGSSAKEFDDMARVAIQHAFTQAIEMSTIRR